MEDQWRATNRLTANLGLRYEYEHLPTPPICNPAFPETCHVNSPDTNFMPRIGLAFRVNDKTVLRAGYGIYYARMAAATLQDLFTTGNGLNVASISLSSSTARRKRPVRFSRTSSAPLPPVLASTTAIQFASPNFSTPYSEQASLAVERELTHSLALTVSYIWSRGVHLYSVQDLNMPTTTIPFTYTIENSSGTVTGTYPTHVLIGQGGVAGARPNPS